MLVVPMSGHGKRFAAAGYASPKPLLLVDGRPIVAHVLDLFPDEKRVLFICNEEHLRTTHLRSTLQGLRPDAMIVGIAPHDDGPVWAILQAHERIPDDEEVMISYCDYGGAWDYGAFRRAAVSSGADGAIPAYIGFHPHLLGPDFYGHMRWKTEGGHDWMLEMQEKRSFTNDKTREYGAAGAYWFRTGALMKTYFTLALERGMRTGSELFCSMPYNLLVHDGLRVLIAQMPWFCQWGTPQDLEEYEAWSRAFAVLAGKPKGKTDIPVGREPNVRARRASPKDTRATFAYWHEFFSLAPWHPYGKAAHG